MAEFARWMLLVVGSVLGIIFFISMILLAVFIFPHDPSEDDDEHWRPLP